MHAGARNRGSAVRTADFLPHPRPRSAARSGPSAEWKPPVRGGRQQENAGPLRIVERSRTSGKTAGLATAQKSRVNAAQSQWRAGYHDRNGQRCEPPGDGWDKQVVLFLLGSGDSGLAGFTFSTGVTSAELRNGSRQLRGGGVSAAAEPNCPQASRRVSTRHTESVRHKRKRPRIW